MNSRRERPRTPDDECSNEVMDTESEYAVSMPTIRGPPFQYEYVLEAQEPKPRQPFLETLISRFPPEIKQMIYLYVLNTEPLPDHLSHYYYIKSQHHVGCSRLRAWEVVNRTLVQRIWPPSSDNKDGSTSSTPVLVASFPPRPQPYARSCLELILICRQTYKEAWPLHSSLRRIESTPSSRKKAKASSKEDDDLVGLCF